jgi:hypothetical protein
MTASSSSGAQQSQTAAAVSIAFERSRTAESMRTVRRWSENARIIAFVSVYIRRLAEILTRWVGGSVLYMAVFGLLDRSSTALSRWIEHSYGYRWLTTEPDPDVIVIDLRETWTVGPIVAVLDRVVAGIEHAAAGSSVVGIGGRAIKRTLAAPIRMVGFVLLGIALPIAASAIVSDRTSGVIVALGMAIVGGIALFETRSWNELQETRVVGLLVTVFEPPDPPDSASSDHAHNVNNGEKSKTDTGNPKEDSETSYPNTNSDVVDDDTGNERNEP